MTNESASQTEPWIESKGVTYAYAYDKGGKLSRQLGVSGIPRAFLVDPSGTIVWEGHPARLGASQIEAHLGNALPKPLYEWPASAKKVKAAYLKGNFSSAIAQADKLGESDPFGLEIAGILRGMLTSQVEAMEAALEEGDVLSAYTIGTSLSKGVKGMAEAENVTAVLGRIAKDAQLKGWLKAQQKLEDLSSAELRKEKDCKKNLKALEKLLKGNEGSFVGKAIVRQIDSVKAMLIKVSNH